MQIHCYLVFIVFAMISDATAVKQTTAKKLNRLNYQLQVDIDTSLNSEFEFAEPSPKETETLDALFQEFSHRYYTNHHKIEQENNNDTISVSIKF